MFFKNENILIKKIFFIIYVLVFIFLFDVHKKNKISKAIKKLIFIYNG